jgi:hypothetical protein
MPELPEEAQGFWEWFNLLSSRRQPGMGASPLTSMEIEAFCRLTRMELGPWEAELVLRLDNAILTTWNENRPKRSAAPEKTKDENELIPVSDVKGIKAMMDRVKAKANARFAARGGK